MSEEKDENLFNIIDDIMKDALGDFQEKLEEGFIKNGSNEHLIEASEFVKKKIQEKKMELKKMNHSLGKIYRELERRN